jgi:hypothetical protein
METNLNSDEYVRSACGSRNDQNEGHETCPLVLFVCCYTGESHIGIPLALPGVGRCGIGLCGLFVGCGPSGQLVQLNLNVLPLLKSILLCYMICYVTLILRSYLYFPCITPELC